MALIPPFFLDCVVAIGAPTVDGTNWIGTGFLVGRPLPEEGTSEKIYNTFLVTNKHVLQNQQSIILRFNSIQGTETRDYPINLFKDRSQTWVGHPSENIDVAVQFINPNVLSQDSTRFSYFKLDETCMNTTEMLRSGVSEGDQLYVLGFPMGIVTHTSNYVIARGGVLSRIRDVLSNHQTNYIIDASVFPGNSGGPVVIRPEAISINGTQNIDRAALIGVVKSYIPYKDVAISQQTGKPKVIFEENSGLALVETVDSIEETVELAFNIQFNESP